VCVRGRGSDSLSFLSSLWLCDWLKVFVTERLIVSRERSAGKGVSYGAGMEPIKNTS
jgi:hypothetical protein